jgi:CHAT domain/Glycosyltransferase family 87
LVGNSYIDNPKSRDGRGTGTVEHAKIDNDGIGPVHQHWLSRRRLLIANGGFAVYAAALAVDTAQVDRIWAICAAAGYGVTTLVIWLTRHMNVPVIVPMLVALFGALIAPVIWLATRVAPTPEVLAISQSAILLLQQGTPYLPPDHIVTWLAYNPYLPVVALFGLPKALGARGLIGDPRVWLTAVSIALTWAAFAIAAPHRRCDSCRQNVLLSTVFTAASPVIAFPLAIGITDPAVIALTFLTLALIARPSWMIRAAAVLGVACAMKVTAWLAVPVFSVMLAARDSARSAWRFLGATIAVAGVLSVAMAPATVPDPYTFLQNTVLFPLGLTKQKSPAAAPLPGHLLAMTGMAGQWIAVGVLVAAGVAFVMSLIVRPPRDARVAAWRLAVGLAVLSILAPATRWAYFLYPIGLIGWLLLTGPPTPVMVGGPAIEIPARAAREQSAKQLVTAVTSRVGAWFDESADTNGSLKGESGRNIIMPTSDAITGGTGGGDVIREEAARQAGAATAGGGRDPRPRDVADYGPNEGLPHAESVDPGLPPIRYLTGDLPGRAPVGARISLLVQVTLAAVEGASTALKGFPVSLTGTTVTVTVSAPGLIALGDLEQDLMVPFAADSELVRFGFTAGPAGLHSVRVRAFAGGTCLGDLSLEISVEAGAALEQGRPRTAPMAGLAAEPGEVTLQVSRTARGGYSFQLLSEAFYPVVLVDRLAGDPATVIGQMVAELRTMSKGTSQYATPALARRRLRSLGSKLWADVVPVAIREQFWAQRTRIKLFTIASDMDTVPWELLYPVDVDNDDGFLVEQFPVVRRVYGQGRARVLRLDKGIGFIIPPKSPTNAMDEVAAVRGLLPADMVNRGVQAGLEEVLELLDAVPSVLHFAGHNAFTDEIGSLISLDGGPLRPDDLTYASQRRAFESVRPLVFLNGCRTAGEIPGFTQMVGWAREFMAAGAGAFIGSLWAVRSSSARTFAEKFYHALVREDESLGLASLRARQAIAADEGDPTWLAYTVYGNPSATVVHNPPPIPRNSQ